jgi:hypothetical protein
VRDFLDECLCSRIKQGHAEKSVQSLEARSFLEQFRLPTAELDPSRRVFRLEFAVKPRCQQFVGSFHRSA